MAELQIKLKRQLFDIFQHCEVRCRAHCCGWDAFDLSAHWLKRWCEFRGADAIQRARMELADLYADLAGQDPDESVGLDRFFNPTTGALAAQLNNIERVLAAYLHEMPPLDSDRS